MAIIYVTWHATMDDRTCPVCMALDGYVWSFETGKDLFPDVLVHPAYGNVWDVNRGSKAHGHTNQNCRCSMTPNFDLSDIVAKIQVLHDEVQRTVQENKIG